MERKIGERQRWAWLAAGLSAIAGTATSGFRWLWVLAGGLAALGYHMLMDHALQEKSLVSIVKRSGRGHWILVGMILLWSIVLMGWTANLADRAFSSVDGFPGLGWVLLGLAAWGSRKGAGACVRCSGVLCLFLVVLYGIVAVFALPDVKVRYLMPQTQWEQGIWTLGLFLLPAGVWYVPCTRNEKKPAWKFAALLLAASVLLAVATVGVLSPELAASRTVPLYDLAQSVSLFGVVERIEPLLSAAITMGVFALLSTMACASQKLADLIRPWKWNGALICALSGAGMIAVKDLPAEVIAIGAIVFGMVIPLLLLGVAERRDYRM